MPKGIVRSIRCVCFNESTIGQLQHVHCSFHVTWIQIEVCRCLDGHQWISKVKLSGWFLGNYCEVRSWWFYVLDGGLVARTLLGLDINGQQSTKSTKFNLFKLVLTYLWKVHLRFAFVTPTQCLFPGYVVSCHALMVSEQVPLQDGNCQTCMSASLSQWGSFQLCAASEPRKRREVQRSLVPAIQGGSWSTKSPTYSTVLAAPADSIASFAQLKWSMPWPNEAHSTVTGEKKLYWKWSDGVWMIII